MHVLPRLGALANVLQVDLRLPHLYRCQESLLHRRTPCSSREGSVVAPQQRHRRGCESFAARNFARGTEVASKGLGESWESTRSVEEGRTAC